MTAFVFGNIMRRRNAPESQSGPASMAGVLAAEVHCVRCQRQWSGTAVDGSLVDTMLGVQVTCPSCGATDLVTNPI